MSMYTLLRNNPVPTNVEMESAFEGMVGRQQMDFSDRSNLSAVNSFCCTLLLI